MSRRRHNEGQRGPVAAPEAVEEVVAPGPLVEEYVPEELDEMPAAKVVIQESPKVLRVAPPRSIITRRGVLPPGAEVLPGDIPAANVEKLLAKGLLILK